MSKQETVKKFARALVVGICLVTKVVTAQPGGDSAELRDPPPGAYEVGVELSASLLDPAGILGY